MCSKNIPQNVLSLWSLNSVITLLCMTQMLKKQLILSTPMCKQELYSSNIVLILGIFICIFYRLCISKHLQLKWQACTTFTCSNQSIPRAVCVLYLHPTLAHESLPSNRHIRCLQWAIPSGMRIIFQSVSTAWVIFPVLYESVFFPDYLLLINLFFLRGRRVWGLPRICLFYNVLAHTLCGRGFVGLN